MTDINRVFLVGRLTRDADLQFTNSGTPISKFSIAVNRSKKNGDKWEDEVSFFDITQWGKMAESLVKYLLKGKQIAVEGELRQSRWEKDGQPYSKVEIQASHIQLLSSDKNANSNNGNSNPDYNNNASQGQYSPNDGKSFDNDGIPY